MWRHHEGSQNFLDRKEKKWHLRHKNRLCKLQIVQATKPGYGLSGRYWDGFQHGLPPQWFNPHALWLCLLPGSKDSSHLPWLRITGRQERLAEEWTHCKKPTVGKPQWFQRHELSLKRRDIMRYIFKGWIW